MWRFSKYTGMEPIDFRFPNVPILLRDLALRNKPADVIVAAEEVMKEKKCYPDCDREWLLAKTGADLEASHAKMLDLYKFCIDKDSGWLLWFKQSIMRTFYGYVNDKLIEMGVAKLKEFAARHKLTRPEHRLVDPKGDYVIVGITCSGYQMHSHGVFISTKFGDVEKTEGNQGCWSEVCPFLLKRFAEIEADHPGVPFFIDINLIEGPKVIREEDSCRVSHDRKRKHED